MSSPLHQLIPSMYLRRLWLLTLLAGAVLAVLAAKLTYMTLAQGTQLRAKAEDALAQRQLIPTVRGNIFDRKGRALAQDLPSWDVAVLYPVINDSWPDQAAQRAARQAAGPRWFELRTGEQEQLIRQARVRFEAQAQQLWQTLAYVGGLDRSELEDRKATIVARVQQVAGAVSVHHLIDHPEESADAAPANSPQPIGEETAPHALLFHVDPVTRNVIEGLIAQATDSDHRPDLAVWKLVHVVASKRREYPCETQTVRIERSSLPGPLRHAEPLDVEVEGVGLALVGQLRSVQKEDLTAHAYAPAQATTSPAPYLADYLPGDQVGRWGVERSCEWELRGARGQVTQFLDSGAQRQIDPKPGADIVLSVDVKLQADIQALLEESVGLTVDQPWYQHGHEDDPTRPKPGDPLCASAVVLDVASGQILAAVGHPGFSLRQLREAPDSVWKDMANRPWLNRPFALPLEPGSTVKPLVLAAATTEHRYDPGETIDCRGMLDPHNRSEFRCWVFIQSNLAHLGDAGHGPLDGTGAIARSCDVFFYTLGRRMGVPLMTQWYQRFGLHRYLLGRGADSQLGEEACGLLPDLAHPAQPENALIQATFMGIGQGPVQATTFQMANAYAVLARGGQWIDPTLVLAQGGRRIEPERYDLKLDPRGVEMALKGLDEAANAEYGTGHHIATLAHEPVFTCPDVRVWGKSGTADATPLKLTGPDGRPRPTDPIIRSGAHAWFVALVSKPGSTRPDYAIAVVVEFGGSGGAVAGPIVNQILYLLRAEGYL
jgi:penicillin-binding protein 2